MQYAFDRFWESVQHALLTTGLVGKGDVSLEVPKASGVDADLAFPCFRMARAVGKDALTLAEELATAVRETQDLDPLIGDVEAVGPFLNFQLDSRVYARQLLKEVERHGDRYGWDDRGTGQTVIVDYSAPNIAKRLHVGHIRSTILGQALVNIYRSQGYCVIGINHLGDWGTQFGVLIAAIRRWGQPQGEDEEAIARLEELYVRFSNLAREDPVAHAEAREWSLRLEQGEPEARELWQSIVELTKRANQRNYDRLGVQFDFQTGESFYVDMVHDVIQEAIEKGVAHRDAHGAVVVELEGLPTFLIQRSDGGTLYQTRDLAAIKYRQLTYHPATIIYVIGQPQELHLKQLFAAARAMGYVDPGVELIHVPFGTIFGPDGKPLSTRQGNMIYLEALLNTAVERAASILEHRVEEHTASLSPTDRLSIAEVIGVGAVIYNDLYQDPKRNITLIWDSMLSLEGNSATYLQYTYARCRSIIRRSKGLPKRYDAAVLAHGTETAVIKHLGRLPSTVRRAADQNSPHMIAEWLYETARAFAAFYRDCPVLEAPSPQLVAARLHLVKAVAQSLKNGLALLGIMCPEQM